MRGAAADIERFVKQLSFKPAAGRYLFHYIGELESRGLPARSSADLHAIRKAANAGKHDAAAALDLETASHLVRRGREAIEVVGIIGSAPGANAPEPAGVDRVYAIFVADYPTGGEVDYENPQSVGRRSPRPIGQIPTPLHGRGRCLGTSSLDRNSRPEAGYGSMRHRPEQHEGV